MGQNETPLTRDAYEVKHQFLCRISEHTPRIYAPVAGAYIRVKASSCHKLSRNASRTWGRVREQIQKVEVIRFIYQ